MTREHNRQRIERLLARASEAVAAMTRDELAHHRHEQRISFAADNVALSWPDRVNGEPARELAERLVRKAAAPCPCGDCHRVRHWRGRALARDADGVVRQNDIATGALFSGELEAR